MPPPPGAEKQTQATGARPRCMDSPSLTTPSSSAGAPALAMWPCFLRCWPLSSCPHMVRPETLLCLSLGMLPGGKQGDMSGQRSCVLCSVVPSYHHLDPLQGPLSSTNKAKDMARNHPPLHLFSTVGSVTVGKDFPLLSPWGNPAQRHVHQHA